jgi:hypothetical protein
VGDQSSGSSKPYQVRAQARSGDAPAVFLVDGDGVISWRDVALLGLTYRGVNILLEQVPRLERGEL